MTDVLTRRGEDRHTQGELREDGGRRRRGASTRQQVQAIPEAKRKEWDRLSPRAFRDSVTLPTPPFRLAASRTVRKLISVKSPVCDILL